MINYLQTKVSEIKDADFQSMIDGLCECLRFDRIEFNNESLSFLLMAVAREKKAKLLAKQYMARDGVLTWKVNKLSPDSAIYSVCQQLATANNTIIEAFGARTVLSVIKLTHRRYCPHFPRATTPPRWRRPYLFAKDLIDRRRENGAP